MSSDEFQAAVLRELAFLVEDYGFRVVQESDRSVSYSSSSVMVAAVFDPRGEIELRTAPRNDPDGYATLTFQGMIGRASVSRVVELLAARLRGEDAALRGDSDFFESLASFQRTAGEAWTAYCSGRGRGPIPGSCRSVGERDGRLRAVFRNVP